VSYHEYVISSHLHAEDVPFYAPIMAAMRKADTENARLLRDAWPQVWAELDARYHAPGGVIGDETVPA
jgi:hypothetical protein